MAKFNRPGIRAQVTGPLRSEVVPSGKTHEGGTGYQRDAKSELFLRATCNFAGEDSFYEGAAVRDDRLRQLVSTLAVDADGWAWLQDFLPWLRDGANIRSAPILLALESVRARLAKGLYGENRQLISSVMLRADEPGEALAYWVNTYGKAIPMPVKRGIADAAARLYTQRGYIRNDKTSQAFRFADVLELTHTRTALVEQSALFNWIITERHGRDTEPPPILRMVSARRKLSLMSPKNRHQYAKELREGDAQKKAELSLAAAGQFEWVLSWLGEYSGEGALSKAEQWELVLPDLGYMALIRNVRNLDQAGLSNTYAEKLAARIANADEVAKSRQLPFRFMSAYKEAPSLRWGHALETALNHSLQNIPELPGRSLILIDTSGSMNVRMSGKSRLMRVEAAALFGLALAIKNPDKVDVYGFADGNFKVTNAGRGQSVLKAVGAFMQCVGRVGYGTCIEENVRRTFDRKRHDRVFIFTDMQTFPVAMGGGYTYGNIASSVPGDVPVYGFNLSGYSHTAMPAGTANRHEMGGLTDATFRIIKAIEDGRNGTWPWQ